MTRPPHAAVTLVSPAASAVNRPLPLIDEIALFETLQMIVRPVITAPFASRGVALNWSVCPAVRAGLAGDSVSEATGGGGGTTSMRTVAALPSLLAATVTVPTAIAVTSPELLTLATRASVLVHAICRPSSTLPAWSRSDAVKSCVLPANSVALAGVMLIAATGTCAATTVIVHEADFPSTRAVITAVPAATALTTPDDATEATPGAELVQSTDLPSSAAPRASNAVAVSVVASPAWSDAEVGATVTRLTEGGRTVMVARPCTLPDVALISALPAATPSTSPLTLTVATPLAELTHERGPRAMGLLL